MNCHAVHLKLHALGSATVTQLAEACDITYRDAHNRLMTLSASGRAEIAGETQVGPRCVPANLWRSAEAPEVPDIGLTDALGDLLAAGRYATRWAKIAGFTPSTVDSLLSRGDLDLPASKRRQLDRAVAAEASRRLADKLEADAAALRAWAARCDRARRGEAER